MGRDDWSMYMEWNRVLSEAMYNEEQADRPAYIDCSDEMLAACAGELGLDPATAELSLARSVLATLQFDSGVRTFAEHSRRLRAWRSRRATGEQSKRAGEDAEPPPVVALLVVFVLAASHMGEDQLNAANAYYPRLQQQLGIDDQQAKKVRSDFPSTEAYWRALNEFLDSRGGSLGLPTAYALGHRYVGIPQSQAVVRAHDRAKLATFFRTFGLVPRSEMIADDLERLLDVWIASTPCPVSANLKRLWGRGKARERIAGVVAVELALWDGSTAVGADGIATQGELRLTSVIRQQFGSRSAELSFAARLPATDGVEVLEIISADDSPEIGVVPVAGSRVRPRSGSRLDPASLVEAVLEVRDPKSGTSVERRPRRVVPLRRDELLGSAVEIDRVHLADDFSLLVQDEPQLLEKVVGLISENGRHGQVFRAVPAAGSEVLSGLPEGWVLFDDVQLYSVPQSAARIELQPLVPHTTAQLNFAAGLRLPGKIRKWSSLDPPEIRAAVMDAKNLTISIWDLAAGDRVLLERWSEEVSAMVKPLSPLDLDDGDYEVELAVNGAIVAISTLRLRSADTPDVITWETCASLNYELGDSPSGAVSASEVETHSASVVDGLNASGNWHAAIDIMPAPAARSWRKSGTLPSASAPPVVLGKADPNSCVVTGKHYLEYPLWMGGRASGVIKGVCRDCGLTKASPARPKWKSAESSGLVPVAALTFDLPQTSTSADLGASWDDCLDALVHVGGGSIGSFERIASQVEGTSLFTDQFLRTLEGLGHIDVRRDSRMQPVEWEANPAYLGETSSGSWLLAGVWSRSLRARIRRLVTEVGGAMSSVSAAEGPSTWTIENIGADALERVVERLEGEAYVVPAALDRMLDALPPLSALGGSIPDVPVPAYTSASIFDLESASWAAVPGVGVPGAYRLEQSFRSTAIWMSQSGAVGRRARIGSIHLVKHLAAQEAARSLVGYLSAAEVLTVPMGADLPGVYGRVAMLCSGRPPQISRSTRSLGYSDVPQRVADRLHTLLAS